MLFSHDLFKEYAIRWLDTISLKTVEVHARRRLKVIANRAFPAAEEPPGDATPTA
jgi:hypothetical protein